MAIQFYTNYNGHIFCQFHRLAILLFTNIFRVLNIIHRVGFILIATILSVIFWLISFWYYDKIMDIIFSSFFIWVICATLWIIISAINSRSSFFNKSITAITNSDTLILTKGWYQYLDIFLIFLSAQFWYYLPSTSTIGLKQPTVT